jgi:propanol-preferring alcohol dehydrogenase
MMKQVGYRLHQWGQEPVWESFQRPTPKEGEVLVEVEACGIGSTVLNLMRRDPSDPRVTLPRVPGHELVGRVVEAPGPSDRRWIGRRITAYFYLYCGHCRPCVAGQENRCDNLAGLIGHAVDGGYAPWVVLRSRNLIGLPQELDPVSATVVADAVATPVHIARTRAKLGLLDRVAIIGAGGGVGIHLVQVARLHGAAVAGLDVTDEKLAAISDLGAEAVRSTDIEVLDPELWPDGRPTVIVDFIGTPETLAWAQRSIERGGRVTVMTSFPDVDAKLDPERLVEWEATLVGSRYASRREVQIAAELVQSGRVRPMIGAVVGPHAVLEVHSRLRAGRIVGRAAIDYTLTSDGGNG